MYENDHSVTTPAAARQICAKRRSLLALTPIAALAATMPDATLGQLGAEQRLIAACGEIIALERHLWTVLTARFSEHQEEALEAAQAPFAATQGQLIKQICAAKAVTLDGCRAKAQALAAWAPYLVADAEGHVESEWRSDRMVASILRDLVAGGLS